jgi:hypothetical protein
MVFKDSAQSIQVSIEPEITGATNLSLTKVGKKPTTEYSYQDFFFQIKILLFFYFKKLWCFNIDTCVSQYRATKSQLLSTS